LGLLKVDVRTINEETVLDLWRVGGKFVRVKRPFDPYFYSKTGLTIGRNEEVRKTLLSTLREEHLFILGQDRKNKSLARNRI
jgi:hypothetical protein